MGGSFSHLSATRWHAALAIAGALLLASATGGCSVEVDYGQTTFSCSEGECPSGYVCESEICVLPANAEPADASVEPADATSVQGPSCDEVFGLAPGYELCAEESDRCVFSSDTNGFSCNEACEFFGTQCLGAEGNHDENLCVPREDSNDDCESRRRNEICICTRP